MDERTFDALSRQANGLTSRRTSLLALGAMALAAVTGQTNAATKGKKKRKRKGRGQSQNVNKLCEPQVQQCQEFVAEVCEGNTCPAVIGTCCPLLGTCQNAEFWRCLISASNV